MKTIYLLVVLSPLIGAISAGLFGKIIGRTGAHLITIAGVFTSFCLSLVVFNHIVIEGSGTFNETIYSWMTSGNLEFKIGFLIDELTAIMMLVVTFISLMVHIYTIGYMHDDPGYQRFFSYIALFTFSMLMLVMANNLLQLFFGWEAVGLVSYLLIGFWYTRDSAIHANMKAFLINRVGDFGFLLGIATIIMFFGTMDYFEIFEAAHDNPDQTMRIFPWTDPWSVISVSCILLFIGAMGKSAQFPLHVWLPDSMEGPTPISALIHAATMVTAGIFMVARMSPLFELSDTALSVVLIIGAITAFAMGLIGIVQNDIKRVIAYSTISQLGYMTVALGASAYSAAIFHLMTHAFFKALLFLGAGSVIIALHHKQDMRKMGGLWRYMPITWITMLIGSLALIGLPGMAGFFSKDAIIEAVRHSDLFGATFAYWCVVLGVFVTAFYTFRMYFLVFHGTTRMDQQTREHCHETPAVVTIPLMLLAVASIFAGYLIDPIVVGDYFRDAIYVDQEKHHAIAYLTEHYHGIWDFIQHGVLSLPTLLAASGVFCAWYIYMVKPSIASWAQNQFTVFHRLLENKYMMDVVYEKGFAAAGRGLGQLLWKIGDVKLIDGLIVNGSAKLVAGISKRLRKIQTGMLYHYAFSIILGLMVLLGLLGWPYLRSLLTL